MRKLVLLTLVAAALFVGAPAEARATATITARLSSGVVQSGGLVTITGKVSPASATKRVVSQVVSRQRWSDRQAAAVDAGGNFSIQIRPSHKGNYFMRVRSSGGSVISNALYLQVTPGLVTIAAFAGTSNGTTPYFNAPSEWTFQARVDCPTSDTWNFVVWVYGSDGSADLPVNDITSSATYTSYAHDFGGRLYFDVTAGPGCTWAVAVLVVG